MTIKIKLAIILSIINVFTLKTSAQITDNILEKKITTSYSNVTIKEALKSISEKTKIGFSYSNDFVQLSQKVSANFVDKPLKAVLDQLILNSKISYEVIGNQVVFHARKEPKKKYNLNGYVQDKASGEKLIGCFVIDSISKRGVSTNAFGYFNLTLNEGNNIIITQCFGYANKFVNLTIDKDTSVIIKLSTSQPIKLNEVLILNSGSEAKLLRPQMGLMNMTSKEVKSLPVLLGEADIMRAIQIMPGIQAANERSTGISVRGGSIDQNLFLLDDAPIFQISHLMGFCSVFNNDAVKDIKVYKGDIPANYGGRLSSLIDVRLKDGDMQKYAVSGGIGLISSNLNIEGPIFKDRVSFMVSGKYSYLGLVFKRIDPNVSLSFYDLNLKINAILSKNNRIYISSYNGNDNTTIVLNSIYQNNTLSIRWNHVYNPKLFSNISMIYSNFNYTLGYVNSEKNSNDYYNYTWNSGIKQGTLKLEYNYYLNNNNTIDFGASTTYKYFVPGKLKGNKRAIDDINKLEPFSNRIIGEQGVLDHSLYISNQQKITDKISLRYGIRANLYQDFGGHWFYKLSDYHVTDSLYVAKNKTYANYFSFEPRISFSYRVARNSAIKASYTYTSQQDQLLVKTNGGGPLDIWFPSDNNIKPQTSSQYSMGFVQYMFSNLFEASIESYYKDMNNIIDYKDGASFLENSNLNKIDKTSYNFEEQLRTGKGYSYGTEIMIKGNFEKLNGFISYTYARSFRKIPDINFGNTYLSPFDKPHTFDVFLNWNISKRVSLSTNFRWQSGQVTTIPIYIMEMWGHALSGYSNRNEYRLLPYQRLDLSLTIKNREKIGKSFHSEWNFSIVNAFNHANITYIDFTTSQDKPNIFKAKGISMLGIIPSISYHFNF